MRQYPLVRLLIPFITGVITFEFTSFLSIQLIVALLSSTIFLFLLLVIFNSKIGFSKRWIRGVFISLMFYFSGFIYCSLYNYSLFKMPEWVKNSSHSYEVEIVEAPVLKNKTIKLIAEVKFNNDSLPITGSEKIMLYIPRDSISEKINYGDCLRIYAQFSEIPFPLNPYEFDYRQFLKRKGIRYQAYVPSYAWQKVSEKNGNIIQGEAYRIRNYFISIFESQGIETLEMGVITAILLGYDDNLDPELSKHYSGAGVTHILCVSGMHVGILYLMLNFFLGFLDKRKRGKIIKSIILLLVVWFYSFLTGMSPSVLRSAAMFTFVIVGQLFERQVSIYNSLLSSLIFLTLLNPNIIYDAGFQLSYLAVFSIVWLNKPLYDLWRPKYKLVDYVWQLASVSISAQILTTPIALFYFHQFPNYFLLANILISLLSTIIMYLGFAAIVFSFVPFLDSIINQLLVWSVKLMNFTVVSIHNLPGSVTSNIDVDFFMMILLYITLFFSLSFLLYKKKYLWWTSLALWILFFGYISIDKIKDANTSKITFYSIRGQSLIEVKYGNEAVYVMDSMLYNNNDLSKFQISAAQVRKRISKQVNLCFSDSLKYQDVRINIDNRSLITGDKSVLFIDKRMASKRLFIPKIEVDIAYVRLNPWIDIEELSKKIDAKVWVFDRSNSPRNIDRMTNDCERIGLKYTDLSKDGAFEIEL